jgi:hypothetical protein
MDHVQQDKDTAWFMLATALCKERHTLQRAFSTLCMCRYKTGAAAYKRTQTPYTDNLKQMSTVKGYVQVRILPLMILLADAWSHSEYTSADQCILCMPTAMPMHMSAGLTIPGCAIWALLCCQT